MNEKLKMEEKRLKEVRQMKKDVLPKLIPIIV